MSPFSEQAAAALRDLARLWRQYEFVLVGAAGIGCHLEMRWRRTGDLDVAVAIAAEDYPAGLERLAGWYSSDPSSRRWYSPQRVPVDVIAAGPDPRHPAQGPSHTKGEPDFLAGFRLAFAYHETVQIGEGQSVRVATLPVLAFLKLVSYQDRPYEREDDLADFAYVLELYVDDNDDRRFADEVFAAQLRFEDTPAFILGRDLASLLNTDERKAITRFSERRGTSRTGTRLATD